MAAAAMLAKDTRGKTRTKVRELFTRTVYSREPEAKETGIGHESPWKMPQAKGEKADPSWTKTAGYEDIIWALINTKDFSSINWKSWNLNRGKREERFFPQFALLLSVKFSVCGLTRASNCRQCW